MNLDPIDIFGETVFEPVKRALVYGSALVGGGWIAGISTNVDRGDYWNAFGVGEFTGGFIIPFALLFSSGGPLVIAGLIFFLMTSARLKWFWLVTAVGASAVAMADQKVEIGWLCWAALNAGLAGTIWLHDCYRRNEWAHGLFELNTRNSMRRAAQARDPGTDDSTHSGKPAVPDESPGDPPKIG